MIRIFWENRHGAPCTFPDPPDRSGVKKVCSPPKVGAETIYHIVGSCHKVTTQSHTGDTAVLPFPAGDTDDPSNFDRTGACVLGEGGWAFLYASYDSLVTWWGSNKMWR